MDLEISKIRQNDWVIPKLEVERLKEMGATHLVPYKAQTGLTFTIGRKKDAAYRGYDAIYYCNMVRRYINSRNTICILHFDMNHERSSVETNVNEVGETCLVGELRVALSGVLCKQIKSNEYELHAVNSTPKMMDIMTSHIFRRGDINAKEWHGDFAHTVKIGTLTPGSELHISSIYMKSGRVFTDELYHFENGILVKPTDNCNFLHNGYVGFEQPEIVDYEKDEIIADPMKVAPTYVNFKIHQQPFIDPKTILSQSLDVLVKDLEIILYHAKNAADIKDNIVDYNSERVSITVDNSVDLTMILLGFDESIGKTIIGVVKKFDSNSTHYTSHREHVNIKKVIVRISANDPTTLLVKCVMAIKDQTAELLSAV